MGSRIIEIHSEVLSHVILLVKEVGSGATGLVELEDESVLFTVPAIPNRAPGIWWAFNEYLLSELMDARGESDLGITNDHAKDNKVIK